MLSQLRKVQHALRGGGHEALAAVLRYRTVKDTAWHEARMEPVGNDRWVARLVLTENTRYVYTIEAYADAYRTWADGAWAHAERASCSPKG